MTMAQTGSGSVAVIGLGPGREDWITPETLAIIANSTDFVGYGPYLARLALRPDQKAHPTDNREELERARHALRLAHEGHRVAVVSGGDPGVFAMASTVMEAIDHGPQHWRVLDVTVHPGISVLLAAGARLGAPFGHDFCAISLSDNLKPWHMILRRLKSAAEAEFVIALYNPASRARPDHIFEAFELLREVKDDETVVMFAHNVGREDERFTVTTLALADPGEVTMATLVIIGSAETRIVARDGAPLVYSPRSWGQE